MCGIWGQLTFNGERTDPAVADAALAAIAHRGPDARGVWSEPGVIMGACRLSIIDLPGGDQPIRDAERGCCIVYNGEIYNYRELRAELERRGDRFATASDTEVALRSYLAWGFDCVRRFNGMFALAIWDSRSRSLFLARDRLGEKPLYVFRDAHRVVFASEIKAILADPSVPREVDPAALTTYLAFDHSQAPRTIFRGIDKLQPGHYLVADGSGALATRYWDVDEGAETRPPANLGEAAEELGALLDDAVRLRLVADVPVGAFLSGGLDSSAVTALMVRHAAGPVRTFTLGYASGGEFDERRAAARVAARLGTEHHVLEVDHVDVPAVLRELAWHSDEPFADPAGLPLLLLARFAREHVKVALVGDGGDELFGGYRRYAADRLAPLWNLLPRWLGERWLPDATAGLPRLRRAKTAARALAIREPARRYAAWVGLFDDDLRDELLLPSAAPSRRDADPSLTLARHYYALDERLAADHANRLMYVDLHTWLPDKMLEKTDKASMAASLEVRSPLLDHRIVELAFRIPSRFKLAGLRGKLVLRRAVADLVPPFVLRRPKRGFAVPLDRWFRRELAGFARELLLDDRTRRRGWLDSAAVERLIDEHVSGRHVRDRQLWSLVVLETWARLYLDREGG